MNTTALLLLSCALIGAGIGLIWRDVHKKRRAAFVLQRDSQRELPAQPDVEVTIARAGDGAKAEHPTLQRTLEPDPSHIAPAEPLDARTVAERWEALKPVFGAALRQVNLVLAAARVSVGAPESPTRSIDGGFGANCRLLIADENVGSLRLQVTIHDQVHARVRAHAREAAAINASSSTPVQGLSAARASDLLSEVLKPTAALAMGVAAGADTERQASAQAWQAIDPIVASALDVANGALAQAGSRFVALGPPAWNEQSRRHRMTVGVRVLQNEVARMHIERIGPEMEVAIGVPDARLANLGRRRRIALQGMTTHALAELIASCAWPAIAYFRETQRRP
jgi:hypothetical protein